MSVATLPQHITTKTHHDGSRVWLYDGNSAVLIAHPGSDLGPSSWTVTLIGLHYQSTTVATANVDELATVWCALITEAMNA